MTTEKKTPNYDLAWLRKHNRLSQEEAGTLLGVNRVTYSRWETGTQPTPEGTVEKFAAKLGVSAADIPEGLAEAVQQEAETAQFVAEVQKLKEKPNKLVAEHVGTTRTEDAFLSQGLPPLDIAIELFRPSAMRYFNIPDKFWLCFTKEKPGENVEELRKAGFSWDQALDWIGTEEKAKAYTLLMVWDKAKREHFVDRLLDAREKKIAMPLVNHATIVAIFEKYLDEQGWGMV